MTRVLFTGPVGSGKSTQAQLLSEYLKIPLFQSGQITREMAKEDSRLGRKIKEIMEKGKLIDDQAIAEAIKRVMDKTDLSRGYVFDGYPRSLEQLKLFNPGFDIVFDFKISDEAVLKRLVKRQRIDDTPEAIKVRLNIYYQQTQDLVEYYNNLGILKGINAEKDIADIQKDIREVLDGQTA